MSLQFNQLNGTSVSDASGNTTLGSFSLQGAEFQRGLNNTAIGYGAIKTNAPSAQHNTAVGLNALSNNAGSNNLAMGENALYNFPNPSANPPQSGNYNVALGNNAMQYNLVGNHNVAIGNQTLNKNSTGHTNVAVGNQALSNNVGGYMNVAIGNQSLNNNTAGFQNVFVGMGSGYQNTTGSNNAALGHNAILNNTTGSDNVAAGDGALIANQTGNSNVAVGNAALQAHTSGDGNVAIGDFALSVSVTGDDNVGIGRHVSCNNNSSCILLGNYAQTINNNEFAMSGINLIAPSPPLTTIAGYMPIRLNNYNISGTPGTPLTQYYIPVYSTLPPPPLPVPEVIIANHSELDIGSGGVGLLIGFPSDYSVVSSVVIANGANTYTISGQPSNTGYYVFYEDSISVFWPNIPSSYANLAQAPLYSPGLCGGIVFGNPLTFTYTILGSNTTVTYTPLTKLNIGDGCQYQQYNGQSPFTSAASFQWGGTGTGNPGSEMWGEQVGTGTQLYPAWQAVGGNYQYNSIYKELYPYTSATALAAPMGSITFGLGSRAITYPYYEPRIYSWIVNSTALTLTPVFAGQGSNATIGTTPGGSEVSSNPSSGSAINLPAVVASNKNSRYYITVKNGTTVVGSNTAAVLFPIATTHINGEIKINKTTNSVTFVLITNKPIPQIGATYTAFDGTGSFSGEVTLVGPQNPSTQYFIQNFNIAPREGTVFNIAQKIAPTPPPTPVPTTPAPTTPAPTTPAPTTPAPTTPAPTTPAPTTPAPTTPAPTTPAPTTPAPTTPAPTTPAPTTPAPIAVTLALSFPSSTVVYEANKIIPLTISSSNPPPSISSYTVSNNDNSPLISIIMINEPTTNAVTGYAVKLNANQNVSTPTSVIITVAQPASGNYASATANITLTINPIVPQNPTIARWISGTGTVYSADAANQSTGAETITPNVPTDDSIFSMVSNETYSFYTTINGTSIFRIPLDRSTTAATTFYSQSQGGRFLTVGCIDLTYLYFIDMNEMNIYRVPLASASLPISKPSTPFVQTGITSDFTQWPHDYTLVCAVDASYIYWNTPNTSTSSGYVARANLNGTMSMNNTFKLVSVSSVVNTFANALASTITRSGFVVWSNSERSQDQIDNRAFSLSYYSDEFQPGTPDNIKVFSFNYPVPSSPSGLLDADIIGSLAVNNDSIYWGYYKRTAAAIINNNISGAVYFDNNGFKTDIQAQSDWVMNSLTSIASNSNPIQSLSLTTPTPTAVALDSISILQQGSTTLRNLNATVSILNNQILTIPQDITIQIPNGSTLTVDVGGSIANNGTITNDGIITLNGTITNNTGGSVNNVSGTINNNSNTIINYHNITNTGTLYNNSGGNIINNATGNIINTKTVVNTNDGQQVQQIGNFTNANGGIIYNIGSLINDGTFANVGNIYGNPMVTQAINTYNSQTLLLLKLQTNPKTFELIIGETTIASAKTFYDSIVTGSTLIPTGSTTSFSNSTFVITEKLITTISIMGAGDSVYAIKGTYTGNVVSEGPFAIGSLTQRIINPEPTPAPTTPAPTTPAPTTPAPTTPAPTTPAPTTPAPTTPTTPTTYNSQTLLMLKLQTDPKTFELIIGQTTITSAETFYDSISTGSTMIPTGSTTSFSNSTFVITEKLITTISIMGAGDAVYAIKGTYTGDVVSEGPFAIGSLTINP